MFSRAGPAIWLVPGMVGWDVVGSQCGRPRVIFCIENASADLYIARSLTQGGRFTDKGARYLSVCSTHVTGSVFNDFNREESYHFVPAVLFQIL